MRVLAAIAALSASVSAFQAPVGLPAARAAVRTNGPQMQYDLSQLPGSLNPLPEWDPAGFCDGKTEEEVLVFREAEITHGRVCMLASLGFLYQYHSAPEDFSLMATDYITEVPRLFWVLLFTFAAPIEIYRGAQWSPICQIGLTFFPPQEEYIPGNIGFDPFNLKPEDPDELLIMQNKELNHGRLAMLATAGFLAQEGKTGLPWAQTTSQLELLTQVQ